MLGIDPRSIVLLAGVMGLLMSLVLFVLRRNYPPSIQGLSEWAAGPFLCFVSTLLFGARGFIPDFMSAVIGNLFLLSGSALFFIGSQRFLGQPASLRLWSGVILASAPVFAWFVLVHPNYVARLVLFTCLMAWLFFSHARLTRRQPHLHPADRRRAAAADRLSAAADGCDPDRRQCRGHL